MLKISIDGGDRKTLNCAAKGGSNTFGQPVPPAALFKNMEKETIEKKELKINYRRMGEQDLDEIVEIGSSTEAFRVSAEEPFFWPKDILRNWIMNSDDPLFVAEHNGKIVRFSFVAVHKATGKATLENIVVLEAYRNKAIGGKLLQLCIDELKKQNVNYLCTLAEIDNSLMIDFALENGFVKGFDFVWLEKTLDKDLWK